MSNKIIAATQTHDGKFVPVAPDTTAGTGQFTCLVGVQTTQPIMADDQVNVLVSSVISRLVQTINTQREAEMRAFLETMNQGSIFELVLVIRPRESELDVSQIDPNFNPEKEKLEQFEKPIEPEGDGRSEAEKQAEIDAMNAADYAKAQAQMPVFEALNDLYLVQTINSVFISLRIVG